MKNPKKTAYGEVNKIEKPAYFMKDSEIMKSMPPFVFFYSLDIVRKVQKKYISDSIYFKRRGE